jgi:hypothetical protein
MTYQLCRGKRGGLGIVSIDDAGAVTSVLVPGSRVEGDRRYRLQSGDGYEPLSSEFGTESEALAAYETYLDELIQ